MPIVTIDLPDDVVTAVRPTPDGFVDEMRIAAAAKWYETGLVSQEKAAAIAGLARGDFLDALARYKVSVWQYAPGELEAEVRDAG